MGAPLSMPRRLLDIAEYYRLGQAGVVHEDDRVELIEGEMIEMAPIGAPHVYAVNKLTQILSQQLGANAILSIQNPLLLPPRNAPQPDVVVLNAQSLDNKTLPGPKDALLIIEVAHLSLE